MIKLMAVDLDNTLFDLNKNIPDSTINAIKRIISKEVDFVIATGRAFPSAKKVADIVSSTSPIICYNGSMVRSVNGDIIFAKYVETELVKEFIDFCTKRNIYLQIYNDDSIIVEKKQRLIHDDPDMKYTKCKEVGDFYSTKIGPSPKLLIAAKVEKIPIIFNELKEKFSNKVYLSQSDSHIIEITPIGINKGMALEKVKDFLGVRSTETMACGDNTNDEFLLRSSGIRVAVANAVPELKKIATYICKNERSLGVEEAISKFILNF